MANHSSARYLIEVGPTPQVVRDLLQEFTILWWDCDSSIPPLGPTYTARERVTREAQLDRLLDTVMAELKRPPRSGSERQATQERILSAFGTFLIEKSVKHQTNLVETSAVQE